MYAYYFYCCTYLARRSVLDGKGSTSGWSPARSLSPLAPCVHRAWMLWVLAAGNPCQKPAGAVAPCRECEVCRSAQYPRQLRVRPQSARCADGSGPASPQKSISPCSQCCSVTCKSSRCQRECVVAASGQGRHL